MSAGVHILLLLLVLAFLFLSWNFWLAVLLIAVLIWCGIDYARKRWA